MFKTILSVRRKLRRRRVANSRVEAWEKLVAALVAFQLNNNAARWFEARDVALSFMEGNDWVQMVAKCEYNSAAILDWANKELEKAREQSC